MNLHNARITSAAPHYKIPGSDLLRGDSSADFYRNIGALHAHVDDDIHQSTGTIINVGDGYGILTCAHALCIRGGETHDARYAVFLPGLTPGGLSSAIALEPEAIRISPNYLGLRPDPYDLAVIRLTKQQLPTNHSGMFATVQTLEIDNDAAEVEVPGYPFRPPEDGDRTPALYYSRGNGSLEDEEPDFVLHDASATKGMSGSGVVLLDEHQRPVLPLITAVHISGAVGEDNELFNVAVYLTREKIDWIVAQLA